ENLKDAATEERTHGAEAAVTRGDLAGQPGPFLDVAITADLRPHFGGRFGDVDFEFHSGVFGLGAGGRRGGERGGEQKSPGWVHHDAVLSLLLEWSGCCRLTGSPRGRSIGEDFAPRQGKCSYAPSVPRLSTHPPQGKAHEQQNPGSCAADPRTRKGIARGNPAHPYPDLRGP